MQLYKKICFSKSHPCVYKFFCFVFVLEFIRQNKSKQEKKEVFFRFFFYQFRIYATLNKYFGNLLLVSVSNLLRFLYVICGDVCENLYFYVKSKISSVELFICGVEQVYLGKFESIIGQKNTFICKLL